MRIAAVQVLNSNKVQLPGRVVASRPIAQFPSQRLAAGVVSGDLLNQSLSGWFFGG
jgi:hypothetical protein